MSALPAEERQTIKAISQVNSLEELCALVGDLTAEEQEMISSLALESAPMAEEREALSPRFARSIGRTQHLRHADSATHALTNLSWTSSLLDLLAGAEPDRPGEFVDSILAYLGRGVEVKGADGQARQVVLDSYDPLVMGGLEQVQAEFHLEEADSATSPDRPAGPFFGRKMTFERGTQDSRVVAQPRLVFTFTNELSKRSNIAAFRRFAREQGAVAARPPRVTAT